jgi:mono/diheme cytochrome c family protein
MRVCSLRLVLLVGVVAAAAPAADPPAHRQNGDLAVAARRVLDKYCSDCHGGTDGKRRGRFTATDQASLVRTDVPVPFVSREKATASQVLQFLADGSMPPAGRERPKPDEVRAVERWVQAGAVPYPDRFDEERILWLVTDDLAKIPAADRSRMRYLSLAHLAETPGANLAAPEAALVDTLLALGKPGGKAFDGLLTPLAKSANTVYRLDLRRLGWDVPDLFERWEKGEPAGVLPMTPFDLLQLENPHPPPTSNDKALMERVRSMLAEMNPRRATEKLPFAQLRAVAYLRADWLADALRKDGKPTPLADELTALKDGKKETPGPNPRPFPGWDRGPSVSAAVWAWYPESKRDDKPPAGLRVFDDKDGKMAVGGEPLQLQAKASEDVYLSVFEVWGTETVRAFKVVQPKDGKLTGGAAAVPVSPNGDSSGSFRLSGPLGGGMVFYLVYASVAEPKAPPVVVGSRHSTQKVFRVLPSEADAAGDGKTLPVARAVVPLKFPKND